MTQLLEEAADTAAAGTAPILFVGDETVVADGALGSWAAPCDAAFRKNWRLIPPPPVVPDMAFDAPPRR